MGTTRVAPSNVLQTFTTTNGETRTEVLVTTDRRVGVRSLVRHGEDPPYVWMGWEDAAVEWPHRPPLTLATGLDLGALRGFLLQQLTRSMPAKGCNQCGGGPVLETTEVTSVHPVSGDSYGKIWRRCIQCHALTSTPFADNG